MLFVTHDLSIAALMGGTAVVMHMGEAVEQGPASRVLLSPEHPYTRSLVSSTPGRALAEGRKRLSLVPSAGERP